MSRTTPFVLGLLWGLVVAVALYASVRTMQYVLFPEPNPATVVWSMHSGYLWRLWIVGFAGGLAAFIAFALARRDALRVARPLVPALSVAAVMITTQALLLP